MVAQPQTGFTYDDLQDFPDDNFRREHIDGELIVTAAPSIRHQRVVRKLTTRLDDYAEEHGGEVFPAPTDVYLAPENVVEPDVIFLRAESLSKLEKNYVRSAPDIVVEVSSPSTRQLEIVRKRELYERFGVPEFWYVDLEADRIEIYRLEEMRYLRPLILMRGDTLESPQLPGFSVQIDYLLGPAEH